MKGKTLKDKFIIELKTGSSWAKESFHNNQEYAEINAEVLSQSRNCSARIKFHNKVVKQYKPE